MELPTDKPLSNLGNVVDIAAGWTANLALREDGSVVSWGSYYTNVPPQATNVIRIFGGAGNSFALLGDGSPHITIQPFSRKIRTHTSTTFYVRAVGNGALSYQWQRNGVDIPGETNTCLTLASVQTGIADYQCRVSNSHSSTVSDSATVVATDVLHFDTSDGGPKIADGIITLKLLGASGTAPLVLYSSADLVTWNPVLTNAPTYGSVRIDLPLEESEQRFFRVVEEPQK